MVLAVVVAVVAALVEAAAAGVVDSNNGPSAPTSGSLVNLPAPRATTMKFWSPFRARSWGSGSHGAYAAGCRIKGLGCRV